MFRPFSLGMSELNTVRFIFLSSFPWQLNFLVFEHRKWMVSTVETVERKFIFTNKGGRRTNDILQGDLSRS